MNPADGSAQKNIWEACDEYVDSHARGSLYHLTAWRRIIGRAYGHKAYTLVAIREPGAAKGGMPGPTIVVLPGDDKGNVPVLGQIAGVLPLIHLRHFFFGNTLISLPFFDFCGVLADDAATEKALLAEAVTTARDLNCESIELRHRSALAWIESAARSLSFPSDNGESQGSTCRRVHCSTRTHKVRMMLPLPGSAEELLQSFKSKLRSQIRRPSKQGLTARTGGIELLDDFYRVFSENMRDLGSPVHSKKLMRTVLEELPERSRIVMVFAGGKPVACSMIVGYKNVLENPWASALRRYSRMSPNMLLYWKMLEYACENDFAFFDFGRSTEGEGTHRFKLQWGAEGTPLHWYRLHLDDEPGRRREDGGAGMERAVRYWQKLPVNVSRILGPMIRKHIGL